MIKLFHTHGWGNLDNAEHLGTFSNRIECQDAVAKFLKTLTYSYYTRICGHTDDSIILDYGSHQNFLLITGISFEEYTRPVSVCLWLDDERNPFSEAYDDANGCMSTWYEIYGPQYCEKVVWVKSYQEFTDYIETHEMPTHVCFDHDLGERHDGYDAAKYLCEVVENTHAIMPTYSCHSMNPVGKNNIIMYIANFVHYMRNNITRQYSITLNIDKEALESYPNFALNYEGPEDWIEKTLEGAFNVKGVTLKINK